MLILWKGWNIEHKHYVMLWFIAYVLYDKDIFRNLSKIYGGAFLLEKSTAIFAKKLYYHRSFTGSSIRLFTPCTKMKFSIQDFFSKCYQINRKLRICSCLLKKLAFFLSINYLKLCSLNNVLSSMSKFYHHKSNWKLQQIDILIPKQK